MNTFFSLNLILVVSTLVYWTRAMEIKDQLGMFNQICQKWRLQSVTFLLKSDHDISPPEMLKYLTSCHYLSIHEVNSLNQTFHESHNGSKAAYFIPPHMYTLAIFKLAQTGLLDNNIWFLSKLSDARQEFLLNLKLNSQVYGKFFLVF